VVNKTGRQTWRVAGESVCVRSGSLYGFPLGLHLHLSFGFMVFLLVYGFHLGLPLGLSFQFNVSHLLHGFHLGLRLCNSFGFMFFFCSFLWVYVTLVGMDLIAAIKWDGLGLSACTLVLVYVSIGLRESQWVWVKREIQHNGHGTTGYDHGYFADLTNSTRIYISNWGIIDMVSEEYR